MKAFLKKFAVAILTAALIVPSMASISYAATSSLTKIKSLTIKVDSSQVQPGDYVDETDISVTVTAVSPDTLTDQLQVSDIDITSSSYIVRVGDELKCNVYVSLSSKDESDYTLKNVTCHVTGGTYISCTRNQDEVRITFKTKAIKGQFDSPDSVEWKDGMNKGQATWDAPENGSGYYDIVLYRDNHAVVSVNEYYGTSYNFYPWMTKTGTYTFKVRTVPHATNETTYGKRSDWTESGDQDIDEDEVSDGSGQSQNQGGGNNPSGGGSSSVTAGWYQANGTWYYKFPDGSLKKNGWEKINGLWYLFDGNGAMKTGWVTDGGNTYYLKESGAMKTGWVKTTDGKWYFLNTQAGGPEGAMLKNRWLDYNGNRYYFGDNGVMSTGWVRVNGDKWYYFSTDGNGPEGALVKNQYIGTFYVGADGAWIENY